MQFAQVLQYTLTQFSVHHLQHQHPNPSCCQQSPKWSHYRPSTHPPLAVCWKLVNSQLSGGDAGWGEEALICKICLLLWCKYTHPGCLQASSVRSLNLELGRKGNKATPPSWLHHPAPRPSSHPVCSL